MDRIVITTTRRPYRNAGMPQRRGLVISNCQCQPLKHALSFLCADIVFDSLAVHLLPTDGLKASVEERLSAAADRRPDFVVSVNLSPEYGLISKEEISHTFPDAEIVRIANMYFSGLHPDLTYIGGLTRRVVGPLGDYHSRIALHSWLNGLSVQSTLELFNEQHFASSGYFDEAVKSISEMEKRDAEIDVGFAEVIKTGYRDSLMFLSVNHPTPATILNYSIRILNFLKERHDVRQSTWVPTVAHLQNYLAHAPIFPVYPEVSEALGLSFDGSYFFKQQNVSDDPAEILDLAAFVTKEFASFDEVGGSVLRQSHQAIALLGPQSPLPASGPTISALETDETSPMDMADEAINKYVLTATQFDPPEVIDALTPIADVEHVQQPWVWMTLARAHADLGDTDRFLEFSKRFLSSSITHRPDFRNAKVWLIGSRVKALLARKEDLLADLREFSALSPSEIEVRELTRLGVVTLEPDLETFDDDHSIDPIPVEPDRSDGVRTIGAPHFAALVTKSVAPRIRICTDVDYLALGQDTSLVRSNGALYRHMARSETARLRWRELSERGAPALVPGTTLVLNDLFTLANYCHWLLDWFPRYLIAAKYVGGIDTICGRFSGAPFERETLNLAGVSDSQIIPDQPDTLRRLERAVVVDNSAIAQTHPIWGGNPAIVKLVREQILQHADAPRGRRRRVFISRADAGTRQVANEPALHATLARFDIEIVSLGGLSVLQQACLFRECELVVGVHGAGLTNIIFMEPGGRVLELFHYKFGSFAYATLAAGCKHVYSYLSCPGDQDLKAPYEDAVSQKVIRYQYSDIWVDPLTLQKSIETALDSDGHFG